MVEGNRERWSWELEEDAEAAAPRLRLVVSPPAATKGIGQGGE